MEGIGKARQGYASSSAAAAVKTLSVAGVNPNAALAFIRSAGDQDSIVTASRNMSNGILVAQPQPSSGQADSTAIVAALTEALKQNQA